MDWKGVKWTGAACSVVGSPPPPCRCRVPAPQMGQSAPRAQIQQNRVEVLCGKRARDESLILPGNAREACNMRL